MPRRPFSPSNQQNQEIPHLRLQIAFKAQVGVPVLLISQVTKLVQTHRVTSVRVRIVLVDEPQILLEDIKISLPDSTSHDFVHGHDFVVCSLGWVFGALKADENMRRVEKK